MLKNQFIIPVLPLLGQLHSYQLTNFTDNKLRFDLTNELHARPFPTFGTPGSVAFLALKVEKNAAARDKTKDTDLLIKLVDRFGALHPQHGATHYSGSLGKIH